MAFPINGEGAEAYAQFIHNCENPKPANEDLKKLFRDFGPFLKPRAAI